MQRLHYPVDIIAQCVRGYRVYALSLRNREEMMAEPGRSIVVDHATPHRWLIRLEPLLDKASCRAQTLLAGIVLLHMIRKGQYQHPQSNGLTASELFYLLAA
ncbi:TPA: hypothetical protein ACGQS5_004767 [Serratia liquefaciens]